MEFSGKAQHSQESKMEVLITSSSGVKWKSTLQTSKKKYSGWRCLHQAEGGYPNPDKMPVVRPSLQEGSVNFTKPLQLMSYEINKFNRLLTRGRWRGIYGNWTAFTNTAGFDDPGDPRADWVNVVDLKYPLPKLMKGIICGGGFYTGVVEHDLKYGDVLAMYPGVNAIDVYNLPSTDYQVFSQIVLEKHWYFHATTRSGDKINNFPQGQGNPVYVPYCLRAPASYPLSWFEPWEEDYLPDPLKIYKPI